MMRLLILFMCVSHTSLAHEWYDRACCSERDCRPLEPSEYQMRNGQWFMRNALGNDCAFMPLDTAKRIDGKGKVRPSKDFNMHGCFSHGGSGCYPLCIYVGGGV